MAVFEAQVTVQHDDGAHGLDLVKGEDPQVIAAWLRAQADRLDRAKTEENR